MYAATFQEMAVDEQLVVAVQVLFACLAGAIVGVERELAGKQAGLRTHMLVATASGLAVGVGRVLVSDGSGDSTRVLHAVVTGVGFIGAGAIWQTKERFAQGLTTAATIFLVAVLGSASGAGAPVLAMIGAVLAVFTLRGVFVVEQWIERNAERAGYRRTDDD
jgi:putative Mg2+ transporter-C (MgtC) family protein